MPTEWWPMPYTEADWRQHGLGETNSERTLWAAYCAAHRGVPAPWPTFAAWRRDENVSNATP